MAGSTEESTASDEGRRVEAIASAVGHAAEHFLTTPDWHASVPEVLERLGQSSGACRIEVVRNKAGKRSGDPAGTLFHWPADESAPAESTIAKAQTTELKKGQAVREGASLILPVSAGTTWWGYIRCERGPDAGPWSDAEVGAMQALGRTFGAAVKREQDDRQRQEAQAKYEALVENLPAIVYIAETGTDGDWLFISAQIEQMIGYTPDEWLHHPAPFTTHVHPDDLDATIAMEARSGDEDIESLKQEYRMYTRSGELIWIRDESRPVRDEEGRTLFLQGVMFDITKEKAAEEQISFMAYHDRLTNLPNRAMLEEHLDLALARAKRSNTAVAVLFLDLDNFKILNDSHGHGAGDDLLRQIADRLGDAIRGTDLVARQGGDEFLVLIADMESRGDTPHADAYKIAESAAARIHDALKLPFKVLGEIDFKTSASIGISVFPLDALTGEELLKNADAAMYESKAKGKSTTTVAKRPEESAD